MHLFVGLGNPGEKYNNTRHNTGFYLLEKVRSQKFGDQKWEKSKKFNSEIVEVEESGQKIILLRPQTYMNSSGDAVSKVSSYYKIDPKNILVIHDDLDLPLGEYKVQKGVGAAGHHGVESIIERLGTKEFYRFRVGIDSPLRARRGDDAQFVLEKFTKEELLRLEAVPELLTDVTAKLIPCQRL